MTDDELVEKVAKAIFDIPIEGKHPWEIMLPETKAALAIATPEIERRVLRDMLKNFDCPGGKFVEEAIVIYFAGRGISLEDE